MKRLKVNGHLWIECNKGQIIGPGKYLLLVTIQKTGSIKSACRAMKMSYRHAWEMTNAINRIYSKPVIEKMAGGINGGSTRLTKEGEKLVAMYKKVYKAFEKFKIRMNKMIA